MKLTPRFVKDLDTGEKCLQICSGSLSATLPLPAEFGAWDDDRQKRFIASAVHEMTLGLQEQRREKQKKALTTYERLKDD